MHTLGMPAAGTLPASWPKTLRIVKDLDLGQNLLEGSLPDLSGWSDTLELLSLPRNKFTGAGGWLKGREGMLCMGWRHEWARGVG